MSFLAFAIVTKVYIWPRFRVMRRTDALIPLVIEPVRERCDRCVGPCLGVGLLESLRLCSAGNSVFAPALPADPPAAGLDLRGHSLFAARLVPSFPFDSLRLMKAGVFAGCSTSPAPRLVYGRSQKGKDGARGHAPAGLSDYFLGLPRLVGLAVDRSLIYCARISRTCRKSSSLFMIIRLICRVLCFGFLAMQDYGHS